MNSCPCLPTRAENNIAMLKNYLTTILRFFRKNSRNYTLNFIGLTLGFSVFLVIGLYISFETNYDRFHENSPHVYRAVTNFYEEGFHKLVLQFSRTPANLAPTCKAEVPQVRSYVRTAPIGGGIAQYQDRKFFLDEVYVVDSNFFQFFTFPFQRGDMSTALDHPGNAVLSATWAEKLFGTKDVIGKVFTYSDSLYIVQGVMDDMPKNSTMQFNMVVWDPAWFQRAMGDWWNNYSFTSYFDLAPGSNIQAVDDHFNKWLQHRLGKTFRSIFTLQQMKDIHLRSEGFHFEGGGDIKSIYFLAILAIFILITSWVNYVNFSVTKSFEKKKEMGLRKVFGSSRTGLATLFLLESAILNIGALLLAVAISGLLLSRIDALLDLDLTFAGIFQNNFWIVLVLLILVGLLISGLYPALMYSAVKPAQIFRDQLLWIGNKVNLKSVFLVIQFSVCTLFILSTLTIYKQMRLLMSKDTGIQIDDVVLIPNPTLIKPNDPINQVGQTFMTEVKTSPYVADITLSNYPGEGYFGEYDMTPHKESKEKLLMKFAYIDTNFINTFRLQIIAGRNLNRSDTLGGANGILINEEALKLFSFPTPEDALGKYLYGYRDKDLRIVGIVKNYNQEYAREKIPPVLFKLHHYSPHRYFSIRMNSGYPPSALDFIQTRYKQLFPVYPFFVLSLRDVYDRQYTGEKHYSTIFSSLAGLAILLASMGLLSILANTIQRKIRSLAIHKMFGAGARQISWLILRDISLAVLIGVVIAESAGAIFFHSWLNSYALRISLGLWFYLLPLLILLIILGLLTFRMVLKATHLSPGVILKNE